MLLVGLLYKPRGGNKAHHQSCSCDHPDWHWGPRAVDYEEGGSVQTEKVTATETYAERDTPKLAPPLNCLHKYTLNKTKKKDVFHQFSFDPYSTGTIVKIFWKQAREAQTVPGRYTVVSQVHFKHGLKAKKPLCPHELSDETRLALHHCTKS